MQSSLILKSFAALLEDPNNGALVVAENDIQQLSIVALACVKAANILKKAAAELEKQPVDVKIEDLKTLAAIAQTYDKSGDPKLEKLAEALDVVILKCATEIKNKPYNFNKELESAKIFDLDTGPKLQMSTRYCPDHVGVSMSKVKDSTFQCPLDKKTYNFEEGFKKEDGEKVVGTSVSNQTHFNTPETVSPTFDTRSDRVNT